MAITIVLCFILSSFTIAKDSIKKLSIHTGLCGSQLTITNPGSSTTGANEIGIIQVTLVNDNNTSDFYEYYPHLYTCDPDGYFGFSAGSSYTLTVKLYCDNDPDNYNYIGIKDWTGNIIKCYKLTFGTHYYTFQNVYGGCTNTTLFVGSVPC